jgi:DNA-binding transcriptional LysR family regulator
LACPDGNRAFFMPNMPVMLMLYLKRIAGVELRHLRYFIALAEEGSVTRAAQRLGIQQPPLSQQLRALEDEIGTALFKRTSRGLQLTATGSSLLDGARKTLEVFEQTLETARRCGRGEHERITIGYTNSGGFNGFVPQSIRKFRQEFSSISVALEECCTAELVDALRARRVDIAFVRGPLQNIAGLSIIPLVDEKMVVAVPCGHRLAINDCPAEISLKSLSEETFLMYRRSVGPGLYDVIIDACARAGFTPRIGQEAPRMVGTLNLVAAGLGITLVPSSMQRIDSRSVAYIPLGDDPKVRAPIQFAFRTGDISPAARLFADLVCDEASAVVEDAASVSGLGESRKALQLAISR